MLGRSDRDRWWDHMHQRWKFRQFLEKNSFPKQELPSGLGKSVMIYASSWLWLSYSLALPANPPPGPQGRSWFGRESSLRSRRGKKLIKHFLVLWLSDLWPGSLLHAQSAERFLISTLLCHPSSLTLALPPGSNFCWVSDTGLLL